jgi:hypothetical protein
MQWAYQGYHYAFLQPVGKSQKRYAGTAIDILLYAIGPQRERVYVGELQGCEVLTDQQAAAAVREYRKCGWLDQMAAQVDDAGGDRTYLDVQDPLSMLNIRFLPEKGERYITARVAAPEDTIQKRSRYTLALADSAVVGQWRKRAGTHNPKSIKPVTVVINGTVTYNPQEAALQGELHQRLSAMYGSENVIMEKNHVDLTVSLPSGNVFIEIKADPDARLAVRKALGQVLEYALFDADPSAPLPELLIISPAPCTTAVATYISALRTLFKLPVQYRCYRLGDTLAPL